MNQKPIIAKNRLLAFFTEKAAHKLYCIPITLLSKKTILPELEEKL